MSLDYFTFWVKKILDDFMKYIHNIFLLFWFYDIKAVLSINCSESFELVRG